MPFSDFVDLCDHWWNSPPEHVTLAAVHIKREARKGRTVQRKGSVFDDMPPRLRQQLFGRKR